MKKTITLIVILLVAYASAFASGGTTVGQTTLTEQGQIQQQTSGYVGNNNFDMTSNYQNNMTPTIATLPPLIFDFPSENGFYANDFHGEISELEGYISCKQIDYMIKHTGVGFAAVKAFNLDRVKESYVIYGKYPKQKGVHKYYDVKKWEVKDPDKWVNRRAELKAQGYVKMCTVGEKAPDDYQSEHTLSLACDKAAKLGAQVVLFRFGSKPVHIASSKGAAVAPVIGKENFALSANLGSTKGRAEVVRDKGASVIGYVKVNNGTAVPKISETPAIAKPKAEEKEDEKTGPTVKDAVKTQSKAPSIKLPELAMLVRQWLNG